eukprot:5817190-Prymnesium_polylepis.1
MWALLYADRTLRLYGGVSELCVTHVVLVLACTTPGIYGRMSVTRVTPLVARRVRGPRLACAVSSFYFLTNIHVVSHGRLAASLGGPPSVVFT